MMHDPVKKGIIGTFIFLLGMQAVSLAAGLGPLQTENRFTPHLMFLTPVPTAPMDLSGSRLQGALTVNYSSLFVNEESAHWSALIDMEMTILEGSLEYRLNRRVRVGIRLPLVSMNSGFMDSFLENYHHSLGVPDYGRETRPKNEFAYRLQKNGLDWISSRSGGLHLADSSIDLRVALLRNEGELPLSADLQYVLKLPLGNAEQGFGSGKIDQGFFIPMQLDFSSWDIYLMPGIILPAKPDTLGADVHVNTMGSAFLGIDYALSPRWSAAAQINYYSSPLETTGIRPLDQGSFELALGAVRQMTAGTALEVAFCEDLSRSAPDFSLQVGLRFNAF